MRQQRTISQQRFLESLLDRVEAWALSSPLVSGVSLATVTSVAAGGASDGNALVVVNWQGVDIPAPYVSSYTPTAGHTVAVVRTGTQLLIVGRVLGTP